MKNREDDEAFVFRPIGNQIGSAGDEQFPRPGLSPGMPEARMARQPGRAGCDLDGHATGGLGLVALDVPVDLDQLGDGRRRPDYLHSGGGNSRPEPQDSSQRATWSWGTERPASISRSAWSNRAA